jgi:hypothetical protein
LLLLAGLLQQLSASGAVPRGDTMHTKRVLGAAEREGRAPLAVLSLHGGGALHGALGTGAAGSITGEALSKQQEWVALDKGLRNAGNPPTSAFKIPELGEEVHLMDLPTSITREQFWHVMDQWIAGGESYIKSVWRTRALEEKHLCPEDWEWALKFRPSYPPAEDAAVAHPDGCAARIPSQHGAGGGEAAGRAEAARRGENAEKLTAQWAAMVQDAWHAIAARAAGGGLWAAARSESSERASSPTTRQVLRRMDRKDVVTAPHVDEWCEATRDECDAQQLHRVSFTPVFPPWVEHESFRKPVMSYLPYNYPKSLRYTFYYQAPGERGAGGGACDGADGTDKTGGTGGGGAAGGWAGGAGGGGAVGGGAGACLRMTAHLFDPGSREFLVTSAHRILTKIDKWARCVQVGSCVSLVCVPGEWLSNVSMSLVCAGGSVCL